MNNQSKMAYSWAKWCSEEGYSVSRVPTSSWPVCIRKQGNAITQVWGLTELIERVWNDRNQTFGKDSWFAPREFPSISNSFPYSEALSVSWNAVVAAFADTETRRSFCEAWWAAMRDDFVRAAAMFSSCVIQSTSAEIEYWLRLCEAQCWKEAKDTAKCFEVALAALHLQPRHGALTRLSCEILHDQKNHDQVCSVIDLFRRGDGKEKEEKEEEEGAFLQDAKTRWPLLDWFLSIDGWYATGQRENGFKAADRLILHSNWPQRREVVRNVVLFYAQPLPLSASIELTLPELPCFCWRPLNPAILLARSWHETKEPKGKRRREGKEKRRREGKEKRRREGKEKRRGTRGRRQSCW